MNDTRTQDQIAYDEAQFVKFGRKALLPMVEQIVTDPDRKWDELPSLFLIGFREEGDKTLTAGLELVLPDELWWSDPDPVAAVGAFTSLLAKGGVPVPDVASQGYGHLGTGMRFESYSIMSGVGDPRHDELIRRRQAGGSVPRYEHVPGSTENRYAVIHSAGWLFKANVRRVPGTQEWTDLQTSVGRCSTNPVPSAEGHVFSGRLVQTLARLDMVVGGNSRSHGGDPS